MKLVILLGVVMLVVCFAIQLATGMLSLSLSRRLAKRTGALFFFLRTSSVLAILYVGMLLQMSAWALAWLGLGTFPTFEDAFYFSGVTFTTVGFGDLVVADPLHRVLAPLEAMTGLIMFAVMTAVFVKLIERELFVGDPDRQGTGD
jgi:hypothetical protein